MKVFRKVLFWSHLVIAVGVGLIVLVMSVTGVLLTYQRQIQSWADTRGLDGAPPRTEMSRRPVAELIEAARAGSDTAPTAITWRSDPQAPVEVAFGRERTVFLNGYTGAILGEGSASTRAFFQFVLRWHRWMGAGGENRAVGKAITGFANLGFLFLVLSGIYLWVPRHWTRKVVRNVTWFRRGLSPKARDFNWHHVIGLWMWAPLVVIVTSGVVISYPWASDAVYRLAGDRPPASAGHGPGPQAQGPGLRSDTRSQQGPGPGAPAVAPSDTLVTAGIDRFFSIAASRVDGWKSLSLNLPATGETVSFTIDRGTGGQPQKRATLVLESVSGHEVGWEPFSAGTAGRQARSILRFAHTGEVLGLAGQTLAGLATLGTTFLVWTGLFLTWRRYKAWRKRRREDRLHSQPVVSQVCELGR